MTVRFQQLEPELEGTCCCLVSADSVAFGSSGKSFWLPPPSSLTSEEVQAKASILQELHQALQFCEAPCLNHSHCAMQSRLALGFERSKPCPDLSWRIQIPAVVLGAQVCRRHLNSQAVAEQLHILPASCFILACHLQGCCLRIGQCFTRF